MVLQLILKWLKSQGTPWDGSKTTKYSSSLHKTTLSWATLRALLASKRILLKEPFGGKKKKKITTFWQTTKKISPVKSLLPFWISKGYNISFKTLGSHGSVGFGSGLCKPSSQNEGSWWEAAAAGGRSLRKYCEERGAPAGPWWESCKY